MVGTSIQLPDAVADALDDVVNARNLAKAKPRATRASIMREAIVAFLQAPGTAGTIGGTR